MYMDPLSKTYNNWGASSCQAAIGMGRGCHCARRLREMFLPVNPYGDWNESMLIYLLQKKLTEFLAQPNIKEKYGIEKMISHKTACCYLNFLGYRYKATPKGQYADGHERDDVWHRIQERMATWDEKLVESAPCGSGRRIITWFHDESVFYAHDRRKKGWYHKDTAAKPYAKGEGSLLMVADFVSADFGWLQSPDGKKSAQRLFKPGTNHDGYFTNDDIQEQVQAAMDILLEFYPQFDHIFVYDNATTHLKRAEDALSARQMPKNIPKEGTNWGIEVTKCDATTGKPVYKPDCTPEKIKIRMKDGQLPNGESQSFYFPEGHPRAGIFKGMAVILEERGFGEAICRRRAECKNFKCTAGATDCCCRRILYNQPDFLNVDSFLEAICCARGFQVLFLPSSTQCWGRAKSIYRTYPESSREDRLWENTIMALESIPLLMICGLNGRQAAWGLRKYCGHRVLPNNIMEELGKEGIV
ncbi:hypothetical protein BYT27DRAFT_7222690 [Phlegmacium glaucopus]|nr:hypothetical protein BYT27DRAFT_7222690 [Phlegmacium glaucopus]